MKRTLAAVTTVAAFLVIGETSAFASTATPDVVVKHNAYLITAPKLGSSKIALEKVGTRLTKLRGGNRYWWHVKDSHGRTGYITTNRYYTSSSIAPATTATTTPAATTRSSSIANTTTLYAWANSVASIDDAMAHSAINNIGNDNYVLNTTGGFTDITPGTNTVKTLINYGNANHVNVYATITNWDSSVENFNGSAISTVLNSASTRSTLESNLVQLAANDGYSGIDLDIEQVHASDAAVFTDFVNELSTQLHAKGKKLAVTVPGETQGSYYPAYNLSAIGQAADLVPVMTYDYHWSGGSAGAIAPLPWVNQVMQYDTSVIPSSKILLGIGAYGYDWYTGDHSMAKTLSLSEIDNLIQSQNLTPSWDSADSVPYMQYTGNGVSHTVYYENQTSLHDKAVLVKQYNLGGIAFWEAGDEDTAFWNAINGTIPTTGN